MKFVTKAILKQVYPKKPDWSHKGQYGKLLIVSGSERITGAGILVGMAAFRAGVDTVYHAGPRRAMDVIANYYPSFLTLPLDGKQLESKHVSEILDFMKEMGITAVSIGNGLWRTKETRKAAIELIKHIDLPMVIDADAIRAMKDAREVLREKNAIILPHADEFREITGVRIVDVTSIDKRGKIVKEEAAKLGTIILLKGHVDIISDGEKIILNNVHSNLMSKGGFGDTLAGICAALISRKINKIDLFTAACAAAYINGKAGLFAIEKHGIGVLPTDAIEEIQNVIKLG
ncbi:MAG: NAD(P)H-hydrate dehydratase [Candidatus Aenigmarchaeota archaeon]|nr:NAD(P)H-hydrate dehydratase [Candidatus Aenigmarchaeota archaeon]